MAFEETPAWIAAAVATGARFVYGGRGGDHDDAELARLAGLPVDAPNPVRGVPRTSHFMMWERPAAFYRTVRDLLG